MTSSSNSVFTFSNLIRGGGGKHSHIASVSQHCFLFSVDICHVNDRCQVLYHITAMNDNVAAAASSDDLDASILVRSLWCIYVLTGGGL